MTNQSQIIREEIQDLDQGQRIKDIEMKDLLRIMKIEEEKIRDLGQDQDLITEDKEDLMKEEEEILGQDLTQEIEKDLAEKILESENIKEMILEKEKVDHRKEIEDHIDKEKYPLLWVKYTKELLRNVRILDSLFS